MPARSQVEKAQQGGRRLVVVGDGAVEELVDRIRRIGTEPAQQPRPHPVVVEDPGVELERRQVVGIGAPALQRLGRRPEAMIRFRPVDHGTPQCALAVRRDGDEVVVVEIEQWRFQHRRQRQVVLRQGEEIAERHQILHRDLVGEPHAVGAGHRNTARLQGGDHGAGERTPVAHQDQDVAGMDRPILRHEPLAGRKPALDRSRDPVCHPDRRCGRDIVAER